MTVGPILAGTGLVLLVRVVPGASSVFGVLPGLLVFALGMALTVAPLTSTVLASVTEEHVGAASGANNAISRVASLLAVALLPLAVGLDGTGGGPLGPGFARAMIVSGALCMLGGVVAFVTVRRGTPVQPQVLPGVHQACQSPATREPTGSTSVGPGTTEA
jgi:hypothetical protein